MKELIFNPLENLCCIYFNDYWDIGKYVKIYLIKDLEKNQKFHIDKMVNKNVEVDYNNYYWFGILVGTRNEERVFNHNGVSNIFLFQFYVYPDSDQAFFIKLMLLGILWVLLLE